MRRPIMLMVASLTAFLSGCPALPNPLERTIRQLGVVSVGTLYNDKGTYEVYGASGFFLPVERSLASLGRVTDRCFVDEVPPLLEDGAFATLLDAGKLSTSEPVSSPSYRLGGSPLKVVATATPRESS